jgi:N-acetylglucosamine kinase-like BadF-type ATPase
VGEYGGAAELVRYAVHAVARAWTRRGPETRLTELFVAHTQAADVADFLEGFSVGTLSVTAAAAPLVVEAARAGDAVAAGCVAWAGRELADLALGVVRQLELQASAFEVVLIGGLFRAGPLLIGPLHTALTAEAPGARLTPLSAPPVIGGVVLAMQQVGRPTEAARERLLETTPTLPPPQL